MAKKATGYRRMEDEDEDGETHDVTSSNNPDKPIEGKKLMGFITALEKLDKKKDQILQENRETYAEAKAVGYDGKIIRHLLKLRKMEPEKRKEQEELLAVYKAAIGMLDDED